MRYFSFCQSLVFMKNQKIKSYQPKYYSAIFISTFQSSCKQEKAGCFTLIVFLMSCDCHCSLALPHDVGWAAVFPGHTHFITRQPPI